MNGSRTLMLGLLALSLSGGCRTAGMGNMAQPNPLLPRSSATAQELVAELNRNAERIETFEAAPSISGQSPGGAFAADGRLAFTRPHNFKLVMTAAGIQEVADIGSNDEEFWFWQRPDRRDKRVIYYCPYDENGESPLVGMLQPDWIVEALGFRTIPDDEAEAITVKPGTEPKTLVLNHPRGAGTGIARQFRRETVLSETTHHILEHRVYDSKNVLLARATVADRDYASLPTGTAGSAETATVPTKLRLEWLQQKLKLDVALKSAKVNTEFDAKRRAALFVEPSKKGERVNLAQLARTMNAEDEPTVRNTRPVPPAGVRLGDPAPLGTDQTRRTPRDPVALTADLGTFPTSATPATTSPDYVPPELTGPDAQYPPPAGYER